MTDGNRETFEQTFILNRLKALENDVNLIFGTLSRAMRLFSVSLGNLSDTLDSIAWMIENEKSIIYATIKPNS